jgi:hypothetical protein
MLTHANLLHQVRLLVYPACIEEGFLHLGGFFLKLT